MAAPRIDFVLAMVNGRLKANGASTPVDLLDRGRGPEKIVERLASIIAFATAPRIDPRLCGRAGFPGPHQSSPNPGLSAASRHDLIRNVDDVLYDPGGGTDGEEHRTARRIDAACVRYQAPQLLSNPGGGIGREEHRTARALMRPVFDTKLFSARRVQPAPSSPSIRHRRDQAVAIEVDGKCLGAAQDHLGPSVARITPEFSTPGATSAARPRLATVIVPWLTTDAADRSTTCRTSCARPRSSHADIGRRRDEAVHVDHRALAEGDAARID